MVLNLKICCELCNTQFKNIYSYDNHVNSIKHKLHNDKITRELVKNIKLVFINYIYMADNKNSLAKFS